MTRHLLVAAVTTGAFCAAFAIGVDVATDMLDRGHVAIVSFASGFLGSLFASLVWRKK